MVRKRSRSAPLICTIDFTGFAVVMATFVFTILIAFMLVPHPPRGAGLILPNVFHAVAMQRANRHDAMVISILRDGKAYFRADYAAPEQLLRMIREGLAAGAERKVYLKVDRNARYGVVLGVLTEVRTAGIEKIGFLVESYPIRDYLDQ